MPRKSPPKKQSASRSVERSISAAVQSLEDLVAPDVAAMKPASVPPRRKKNVRPTSSMLHIEHKKKLLLWSGVTLFTLVIFTFWFINTRTVLSAIQEQENPERALIDRARADAVTIVEAMNASVAASTPTTTDVSTTALEAALQASFAEIFSSPATTTTATSTETATGTPENFPVAPDAATTTAP